MKPRFFSNHDETMLIFTSRPFAHPARGYVIFLGKALVYGTLAIIFLYQLLDLAVLTPLGVNAHLPPGVFNWAENFTICYFVFKIKLALDERRLEKTLFRPGTVLPQQITLNEQMRMLFPAALGPIRVGMYPPSYIAFREWEQEQADDSSEEQTAEVISQQVPQFLFETATIVPAKEEEPRNSVEEGHPKELEDQQAQETIPTQSPSSQQIPTIAESHARDLSGLVNYCWADLLGRSKRKA